MDKSLASIEKRTGGTSGDGSGELRHRGNQAGYQGGRLRGLQTLVYFQVYKPDGTPYCQATWESDAWNIITLSLKKEYYYERVEIPWNLPVDVKAESLGYEDKIDGQVGLPESEWTEL